MINQSAYTNSTFGKQRLLKAKPSTAEQITTSSKQTTTASKQTSSEREQTSTDLEQATTEHDEIDMVVGMHTLHTFYFIYILYNLYIRMYVLRRHI